MTGKKQSFLVAQLVEQRVNGVIGGYRFESYLKSMKAGRKSDHREEEQKAPGSNARSNVKPSIKTKLYVNIQS